jgi:lysozyme
MNPAGNITVAELAARLICSFEGCRLTAYKDSGGVWTIGFGHTGGVTPLDIITQAQADAFLVQDAAPLLAKVAGRPLLEAAALVSFGYNVGIGALERVLAGHALLTDFVHDAHGVELAGLVHRRELEQALILVSQQR